MIKIILKKLFRNRKFKVLRGNLKGIRFMIGDLFQTSVLWKDFEPDKQFAFNVLINADDVIFDIGANIGMHTAYIAKTKPASKIYSFEPLPANLDYLRQLMKLNDFTGVTIVEAAVGNENGVMYFEEGPNNYMGRLSSVPTKLQVKTMRLDDFCTSTSVIPDFMKIDVEGFEHEVLKGAGALIKKYQPVMIIELHNPKQDLLVADFLLQHQYRIFRLETKIDRIRQANKFLQPIKQTSKSWPEPDGVWGNVVAMPPAHLPKYERYVF